MRRVAVIGCGGAGKTTLARELGAILDLPVIHGDLDRARFEAAHAELIERDRWVIDAMRLGTLDERLARADTAVFLDRGAIACLWGIVCRRFRYRGGLHADGVADFVDAEFLRWVVSFSRRVRPRIEALLERHAATTRVVVLRSTAEANAFVSSLAAADVGGSAARRANRHASSRRSTTATGSPWPLEPRQDDVDLGRVANLPPRATPSRS